MAKYFYDSETLDKRMNRELSIEALTEGKKENDEERGEEVLHLLIRKEKNHKKPKKQIISESDLLRDDFFGQVLRDYNEFLEQLTNDLKEEKGDGKRYLRSRAKYQVKNDMLYTKDSLTGTFGYQVTNSDSTVPDLDIIDLKNLDHVKALLSLRVEFDPNNDLSFIIMDLDEIIEKALDDDEKFVVDALRDDFQITEIAEATGRTFKQMQYKIRKIREKIANF